MGETVTAVIDAFLSKDAEKFMLLYTFSVQSALPNGES
jgi:hypothetical protein